MGATPPVEGAVPPNPWNPLVWVVGDPIVGEGTWVGPFCLLDASGGLTIGRGCDLAAGVHVYTHSTAARCVTGRVRDTERRPVSIGDRTFIGANTVVLMGVTVGSGCIIGAASVVTKDVPDGTCATGVPARVVGTVDQTTGQVTYHDR